MTIRRALRSDIPSILRIEQSSFSVDAWDRDLFVEYLRRPDRCLFYTATIGATAVGYVVAVHGKTFAEIDSIAVLPKYRGRGIAEALLKRAIGALRRRGFTNVSLNVRLENEAAIWLYRKLGFRSVRRVNRYYEDGAPALRMRRGQLME